MFLQSKQPDDIWNSWWMSGVVNVWGGERLGWWISEVVNVWGGERLILHWGWWTSGVVNVWGGERLGWWTSGVVNVWFYTGGGERLGWWTSYNHSIYGGVNYKIHVLEDEIHQIQDGINEILHLETCNLWDLQKNWLKSPISGLQSGRFTPPNSNQLTSKTTN